MIGVSLSHGQDPWTSKQKTVHLSLHKVLLHLHVGPQQQGEGGVHIEQRSKQHVKSAQQTIISPRHPILGGRTIAALQQQQPETSVSMLQHPIASEIRWTTRAVDKADPRPSAPKRRGEQRSYSCSWGGVAGIKRGPTPARDWRRNPLGKFFVWVRKGQKVSGSVTFISRTGQIWCQVGYKWDTSGYTSGYVSRALSGYMYFSNRCAALRCAAHDDGIDTFPRPPEIRIPHVSRSIPHVSRMHPVCI